MTDLQETINPVNNTGANPPENLLESSPLEGNPGEIQESLSTEQPEMINEPQEVIPEQPVPVMTPDLSSTQENTPVESSLTTNDTPTSVANPQNNDSLSNTQAMINAAKKEKLAQLLKAEGDKGKKSGFIKGILSGVGITLGILAISVILAKDQIVDLLSNNLNLPSLEANVTNVTNDKTDINSDNEKSEDDENIASENEDNTIENDEISTETEEISTEENENLIPENENNDENSDEIEEDPTYKEENDEIFEKYYSQINDILESDMENNEKLDILEQLHKEILSTNPENENLLKYIDERIMDVYDKISQGDADENIDNSDTNEESENENNNTHEEENVKENVEENVSEENIDESNTNEEENINNPDNNEGYSIKHVNSEEEANWVLPSHCSDLTCYGDDKEFSPCTSFRLAENLDENSHRIGNGGACRYKDASELVYVEFK